MQVPQGNTRVGWRMELPQSQESKMTWDRRVSCTYGISIDYQNGEGERRDNVLLLLLLHMLSNPSFSIYRRLSHSRGR
jgi:hypothetical protein